jgi:hypothetical protein
MIPAIVEQYIQKLQDPSVKKTEKENVRYVIQMIHRACETALAKYDGRRG